MKWQNYLLFCVLLFIVLIIGYLIRGVVNSQSQVLQGAMAYGFQEDKQVWNRIRVDEQGHVLCHKEK